MKLASWNVNGIRAVVKKGTFQEFVKKERLDVICLQETKAERGQAVLDLPQYEEFWNSAEKKGYSGTAIFIRKDIEVLDEIHGLPEDLCAKYRLHEDGYGDPNREGRVIAIELEDLFVVTVYTPNSKDDLSRIPLRHTQWDPAFLEYMKRLDKEKPVAFCGDLNVAHTPDDLANPKPNAGKKGFTQEERSGIDNMLAAGFVDTFRLFTKGPGHYTWWSHFALSRERNVGWRIDYWFVSKALQTRVKSSKILANVMGSDHCPVVLELK
jgi:exodeoxyribonuclease-3